MNVNFIFLFGTKQNVLSIFSPNTFHFDYIPQLGSGSYVYLGFDFFLKIKS